MPTQVEYDAPYYLRREASQAFQAEGRAILRSIRPAKTDTILEVGCGSGFNLRALTKYHCKLAIGLDWLPSAAKLASQLSPDCPMLAADTLTLPFKNNTFTRAISQHVIEHFEDPCSVLREWWRVLKPAGLLVLTTPNRRFPKQDWFFDPSHYHIYTIEGLAGILESAGFKVKEQKIINPFFLSIRFQTPASKYLQWFSGFPLLSARGMSLFFSAEKVLPD